MQMARPAKALGSGQQKQDAEREGDPLAGAVKRGGHQDDAEQRARKTVFRGNVCSHKNIKS